MAMFEYIFLQSVLKVLGLENGTCVFKIVVKASQLWIVSCDSSIKQKTNGLSQCSELVDFGDDEKL